MKKPIALLLAACAAAASAAEPQFTDVPTSMQKVLQGNSLASARLQQGQLLLASSKRQVSELTFASFVFHTVCAQQWRHPEEFARWQLTRVQLLDASGQQGFAFDARGDVCERMGRMGQNYRGVIAERTAACSGGQCPAQP